MIVKTLTIIYFGGFLNISPIRRFLWQYNTRAPKIYTKPQAAPIDAMINVNNNRQ